MSGRDFQREHLSRRNANGTFQGNSELPKDKASASTRFAATTTHGEHPRTFRDAERMSGASQPVLMRQRYRAQREGIVEPRARV